MTDNTPANTSINVPVAKINGDEIRRLRECKGLTQLYMATVIGVTTDTISRWENRRYPTIKLENAEKLAHTLEVDLEAILEQEENDTPSPLAPPEDPSDGQVPQAPPEPATPANTLKRHWRHFALLLFTIFVVLGSFFWWQTKPAPMKITVISTRILPKHVPPGQTFPVLITVNTNQPPPVTLILKENLPSGCRIISADPPLTTEAEKSGAVKWISRMDKQTSTFAYLVRAPNTETAGAQLQFSGELTVNQGVQGQKEISGATSLELAPFHWADVDRNNKIDDEEILAVYDRYSSMKEIDFGRDLIDDMWAGSGYVWERKSGKYVVQ
ncbi:MAG: helix-turn-helix transcriptional regulator [Desulfobulbaceae bacterium]|nr:helix-turn-helix transcriptional regulator [Desulfobulbaceae bacterium]